ncbi:hypothetical protein Acsp06_60220 [Actinomycetospora sp. NBRC 106375]|uniref:SHOCT domain-containing protein n=1 Tax=Actinomycetospora sp. NBRC 106375 TaxID=3032207 RepID=UPI0024A338F2|nr:SHOCT domain-containing protein [Actinomycetospora sp. NBRC 106375]GLZ49837.1 hypothetical protein Acsp06_60220 [Actinomycetospora sp. NBRC 106375]
MMWGYGWGGAWMGPLMGVSAVLWWVLVVVVVLGVARWWRAGPGTPPDALGPATSAPDAREILDQRFARGEIDADDYAERRRVLTGG